jgi:urease beta subunit
VDYAGARAIYGFRGLVMGDLSNPVTRAAPAGAN